MKPLLAYIMGRSRRTKDFVSHQSRGRFDDSFVSHAPRVKGHEGQGQAERGQSWTKTTSGNIPLIDISTSEV